MLSGDRTNNMSNGQLKSDPELGDSNQSSNQENDQETAVFINQDDRVCRRSSGSQRLFQAVRDVMTRRSSSPQNSPVSGTPLSSKRSHSLQSPAIAKRKMFLKNRFKSTWMTVEVNEADLNSDNICKISDSPNWTFKLATKGNVKQLASICNINPDRMMARDRKGATVLHYAAASEQISMIEFILGFPGGNDLLNATDDLSSTPLHWAIENDKPNSVKSLLTKGADPTLKNSSGYPALLIAVQKNSLNSLQALLEKKVDVHVRGNAGVTALHVAAVNDNAEAFKMLLDTGAKPCMSCTQGYYPLHAAALAGSRKVMTLLLDHCQQYGYASGDLLSFGDKESSSPLHCAVTGGNIVAIKLCLEYGARLDVKQADDSTPMHMVCGQGTLDIVKTMFEIAADQAQASLSMLDKMDHSPLHKAAMFNHPSVIKYLVEKGADLEISDAEDRTPLLVAASRECWESVRVLIQLGADVLVKDSEARNIMHIVILKGGDISKISSDDKIQEACRTIFNKPEVKQLLNEADSHGCSPLHYACQEGNLASLKTLMCLGVSARLKSCKKQSPLHFASMYGRFNATRRLLDSGQGPNIINEKDEDGMTPLHFAAKNGHVKVLQLLLNRGAILHRNIHGESPLHVAASSGYTKTIRTLIETHNHLIDQFEAEGNTALHLAAKNGHVSAVEVLMDLDATFLRNNKGATCFTEAIVNQNRDVAMAIVQHSRWEEAMSTFYEHQGQIMIPIMLLIQYLPDVCVALLNRCKETADVDARSRKYWIRYHFKYLEPTVEKRQELWKHADELKRQREKSKDDDDDDTQELGRLALPALNKMVEFNRVECLRHPVSVQYLRQKWGAYGRLFHGINLLFYLMSLFPITYIVSTVPTRGHWENHNSLYSDVNGTMVKDQPMSYSGFQIAMMVLSTILNCGQIIKEIVQIYQQRFAYLGDFTNLMEWTLYITSVLYVVPFLTGYPVHWQFEVGAIAIFLAWFNLLIFLQKFDIAGIYVVMFLQILQTLVQVILVFSFLIVAFALSFYVLMQEETDRAFKDPPLAMLRISTMLLGEIGYVEKFLTPFVDDDPATFHFGIPSLILLLVFILMMPILLMNLLIGLAVGDIAQVQNNAVLQRLAMQVQLHTSIETRLPIQFLMRVDKPSVTLYPNRCGHWHKRVWHAVFQYTGIQADYGDNAEGGSDPSIQYMQVEMQRQKQRLKTIQASLDKQHDLLRLIVQKMEIRSEAEDQDEGTTPSRYGSPPGIYSALPGHSGSKLMALRALKALKP